MVRKAIIRPGAPTRLEGTEWHHGKDAGTFFIQRRGDRDDCSSPSF
jgi:hypothetical protein